MSSLELHILVARSCSHSSESSRCLPRSCVQLHGCHRCWAHEEIRQSYLATSPRDSVPGSTCSFRPSLASCPSNFVIKLRFDHHHHSHLCALPRPSCVTGWLPSFLIRPPWLIAFVHPFRPLLPQCVPFSLMLPFLQDITFYLLSFSSFLSYRLLSSIPISAPLFLPLCPISSARVPACCQTG